MSQNIWRRWVSRLFQQTARKRLRLKTRARRGLVMETLEDRLVPATYIWTGLGTGATAADWSNVNNWSGGVAPVAGADIVFSSATAPIKATIDNIGLATGAGFDSISFSASGYSIAPFGTNKLVVTGAINATANLGVVPGTEPTITAPVQLSPSSTNPQQTITVGSDTILDIKGAVSGNSAAQTVYKAGIGELELDANNSAYTGAVNLSANGGIVLITNNDALGTGTAVAGDPNSGITTVNANAQLQVSGGLSVPEQLILNGPGFVNDGAILNVSGSNTWTGQVQLDSNSSFGSTTGNLTFTNTISDVGAGFSATKVGFGTITFATADTYRGQTIINNGILAIQNPLALGAGANSTDIQSGTPGSETIVNYNGPAQTFGTLELQYVGGIAGTDPNAVLEYPSLPYNAGTNPVVGFQVFNDLLVLNGPGADPNAPGGGSLGLGNAKDYLGALYNLKGNNGWDGNVTLGSTTSSTADPVDKLPSGTERNDVFIGAATASNLTISGTISEPNTSTPLLDKVQPGRVILASANTYSGIELYDYAVQKTVLTGTEVDQGDLMITDSTALGTSAVTVENLFNWPAGGASLELGVDSGLDGTSQRTHNVNLGYDSITGSGQGITGIATGAAQEIYIPGSTTTGTFTLSYKGKTTTALAFNASAAAVQSALDTLSTVTAEGGVTVSQDGDVYRVVFGNSANTTLLTINTTTISNTSILSIPNTGSGQEVYIPGSAGSSSSGTFTLTFEGKTTSSLPSNVSAANLASALNALSTVTAVGGVTVTQDGNVYRVIFGTSVSPNVPLMTITTTLANAAINPIYGLDVLNPITIAGTGVTTTVGSVVTDEGALSSVTGINTYSGSIQIGNAFQVTLNPAYNVDLSGSIGVTLDSRPGHTSADNSYATYDYKLTIPNSNQISSLAYELNTDGLKYTTFSKYGTGQLVIANSNNNDTIANPFSYTTEYDDPAINNSPDTIFLSYAPGPTDIESGWITVEANDALGDAIVNPALSELQQPNSITVANGASLQLLPPEGQSITLGNNLILSGLGIPATTLSVPGINFNMLTEGAILSLGGDNLLTGTIQLDGTAGIGVDDPLTSDPLSLSTLTITGEVEDFQDALGGTTSGGIEKLGSRELIMQGPGTYTGDNTIESGTFLLQNNTGLGQDTTGTSDTANPQETYTTTTTTVAAGGLLELGNTNPTTNGGIATGVSIWNEQLVLNGGGQQLNISGSGGTFTLSYTNPNTATTDTTAAINVASTTLASDIQTALNALANIGGAGDSVTVTSTGITGLFSVVFNGALATIANPLLVATPGAAPGNATVTVSGTTYPIYALDDNLWTGGLRLTANTTLEVANNALLTIQGPISDNAISAASGAALSLNTPSNNNSTASVDNGQLVLSGSNTYRGTTYVNAGILTVANSQALGSTGGPEVQSIAVGGTTGQFTLTFDGYTTGILNVNSTILASNIQTQLDDLLSVGGVGGSVTVVKSLVLPNTYNVSFSGGSLAGTAQPLMTWTPVSGLPGLTISEVQQGYGGTIVSGGAQLQVQGNLTIAGEALEVEGSGQSDGNNPSAIPVSWEAVGPAPSNNGQTAGANAVTGRVTGVATDPTDANVIYISTAGGGAWRTINAGLTWTPLFDGLPEIQTITINTTSLFNFTLSFGGQTTASLSSQSQTLALSLQNALDSLSSIGGVGASVVVTQAGNVFTVTFGGAFAGSPEALLTSNQTTDLTIAQIQVGVSPNVALFSGAIAVDPNNVNIIYLGTGEADNSGDSYYGTGVYVSDDYGATWSLLTGTVFDSNFSVAGQTGNPLFGAAISRIVVDPDHANTIYVSSSNEAVNDPDPTSHGVGNAGVWRWSTNPASPDIGWTDLTNIVSLIRNEGAGSSSAPNDNAALGLLDIVSLLDKESKVDPDGVLPPSSYGTPSGFDLLQDGGTGASVSNPLAPSFGVNVNALPSIYNYAGYDLYDPITTSGFPEPYYAPETSGPDDNWDISFPNSGVYSDLAFGETSIPLLDLEASPTLGPEPTNYAIDQSSANALNNIPALFVALGDTDNDNLTPAEGGPPNAVYRLIDPFDASDKNDGLSTVWDMGDGNTWTITPINYTSDPISPAVLTITYDQGNISGDPTTLGAFPLTGEYAADTAGDPQPDIGNIKIASSGLTEYAAITWSTSNLLLDGEAESEYVFVSTNGGNSWEETTQQPPNYMNSQGWYDSSIVASPTNPEEAFIIGDYTNGADQVLETTNGGNTWTDISQDSNGNGPHTDEHASAIDANGNLIVGNDGGVWEYNTSTNEWSDLNGNLAITTLNGVGSAPGDPQQMIGASQDNGTEVSPSVEGSTANGNDSQAWTHVDSGDGGEVYYDPQNAEIAYHVINNGLRISTDGGQNWSSLNITLTEGLYFPFIVDPVNSERLLVGGTGLIESLNQGQSWENLAPPAENVSALALASYQGEDGANGTYIADPAFPNVTDQGANTYDPNTIYITGTDPVTGNQGFWVTKNDGLSWSPDRVSGMDLSGGSIEGITVNPLNRDNVYAVIQGDDGGQNEVLESTNAGQTWTNITKTTIGTANLPNVPFWTLTIDPRTNTLYLGTDVGVYSATPNGTATTWTRFGVGLPDVQVKVIDLDMSTNTLTAATYGRSAYQFTLDDPVADSGAVRAVAGISVWTGPVRVAGATTLDADGIQNLPLGEAQLDFQGVISDLSYGADSSLTKIGVGNIVFSGGNTYGGTTTVAEGVLIANNFTALGANTTLGTTVDAGASLELNANLDDVPVTLYGRGIVFNNHDTGSLRNISGDNTFFGDITLDGTSPATVTIGADSGTELTLDGVLSGASGIDLIKEETGTVILNSANTYSGNTYVYQGALQAENSHAFSGGDVETLDGAQVQIQATTDIQTLTVSAMGTFELSFTGPDSTGTTVTDTTSILNLSSSTLIGDIQAALNALLNIGGIGGSVTVTELTANVYTIVFGGTLLGEDLQTLAVKNLTLIGGTITPQTIETGAPITVANPLTLTGTGINRTGALLDTGGNNTWSGPITFAVLPNFSPFTTSGGTVALGANQGDTLTIGTLTTGGITDQAATGQPGNVLPIGLLKVDAGIVDLPSTNAYTGTTEVLDGILDVQNVNALGNRAADYAPVLNTVQQIETLDVNSTASAMFTMRFDGHTAHLKWNTSAAKVQSAFDAAGGLFAQAGIVGATVAVTRTELETTTDKAEPTLTSDGFLYTITFQGSEEDTNIPVLITGVSGVVASGGFVSAGNVDVVVDNGGEIALDDSVGGASLNFPTDRKITLNGDGPSGTAFPALSLNNPNGDGALYNYIGNNTWAGSIELATASQIGAAAATSLTLTGTTTSDGLDDSLEKVDPGLLIYSTSGVYTGEAIVTDGTLQADGEVGTIDGVVLNGGTLSGGGEVGLISSTSPLSGDAGTIDPGDNYPTEAIGTLNNNGINSPVLTKQDVLNSDDTVYMDIGPHGTGTSDLLAITNAGINLGGATLTGLVDPSVSNGDSYTLITTDGIGSDTVTGQFAGVSTTPQFGGTIATIDWIDNEKFEVDYFATKVVITRELATVTMALAPSVVNPVYGQNEEFIATLTPEANAPPVTGNVVFSVQYNGGAAVTYTVAINSATGVATLDGTSTPQSISEPLTGGTYTVTASYNGDNSSGVLTYNQVNNVAMIPPTVTVSKAPTAVTLVPSDGQPVYGETLTLTATVTTQVAPTVSGTLAPTGTVKFYDNISGSPVYLGNGTLTFSGTTTTAKLTNPTYPFLSVGTHLITAVYSGDTNYASVTSAQLTLIVNEDPTTTTVTTMQNITVYGQPVTFTAKVAPNLPGSGTPTGTVSFERVLPSGTTITLGTGTLSTTGNTTTATYTTTQGQLPVATSGEVITAVYNGDGTPDDYLTSSGTVTITVDQDSTSTVILPSSSNPSVYGQPVTFTAQVSANAPGAGNPSGTVQFFLNNSSTPMGIGILSTTGGVSTATYTTTTFQLPVYPAGLIITAKYLGDTNFVGSSTTSNYLQTVNKANTATTEISSAAPAVFGQQVTFTAEVLAQAPGAGTPTGTVTFTDTTTNQVLGTGSLAVVNGVDEAFYTTNASQLNLGVNQVITARYSGDSNFNTSSNTLSQNVVADATTVTVGTNLPLGSVYGQPVTFTATVAASAPGSGTPAGSVVFMVGTTVLSNRITLTNGVASYVATSGQLPVGNDTISVVYTSGTPDFGGSTGTLTQVVKQDSTATGLVSSGPSVYGNPVTFTSTVTANNPGAGNPSGTVTFYVTENGSLVKLGTGTLGASGANTSSAVYTTTGNQLPVGTNQVITAVYSGDTNFSASAGAITQTVSRGLATVALTSTWSNAPSNDLYGEEVTFVVQVSPSSGTALPTGTVTFSEGGTVLASNVALGDYGGVVLAAFTTTPFQLPAGLSQTITATYNGDSNYGIVSGTELQSVSPDPTTTALTTSSSAINVGQIVTLTTTVQSTAPGSGVPAGVVSFKDTTSGVVLGAATLVNGVATFQTSFSSAGVQSVVAIYNGNTQYVTSTSTPITETINPVGTRASKVTVVSSLNPSLLGEAVTFTATVKDAGTGKAQTPAGVVSFLDGTTLIGTGTLSTVSGTTTATFTTSSLPQGGNSITAVYAGNSSFAKSTSPAITQTVNPVPVRTSTLSLASSSTYNNGTYTSSYGQTVTFKATVVDTGGSPAAEPTGPVTFSYALVGSTIIHQLGSGTLSGSGGTATATFSTATLAVGDYIVYAIYEGDKVFAADAPADLAQNVAQIGTTTTLTSSTTNATSVYGQAVTFTAKVAETGGTAAPGSVVFMDQTTGAVLGTVTLSSGKATLKTAALAVESHTIVAVYSGSTDIAGSTGTVTQTVNQDFTNVGLSVSTTNGNTSLTISSSVTAASPGSGTPTGTVNFYVDSALVGTAVVSGGVAKLTLSGGVTIGQHTLEVVYSGDTDFLSNSQTEVIDFTKGRNT